MTSILRDIKILHLEPTDVCQLACPLCSRETDNNFNKKSQHHLSVEQVENICSKSFIENLDKMFMCGNYGDPAAGKHTIELFQHFKKINPGITLGMNTNGALQNTNWWKQLATILCDTRDYVVFSIDGLEDTNHIYRKFCDWNKLMQNVSAFINAGGSAHWDMLIYRHNQHQVETCKSLAKDLGFKWFRAKISKRPLVENLEYPINWTLPKKENVKQIKCMALNEKSIYIDAQGRISPCCWLGNRNQGLESEFIEIQQSWSSEHPNTVCLKNCSFDDKKTRFEEQWRVEVEL